MIIFNTIRSVMILGKRRKKIKKLATRFSLINLNFIVFILILTVVVCAYMIYNIADAAAMDFARSYTMESVDILGSHINSAVRIANLASTSETVREWFADENDSEKKAAAHAKLMLYADMLDDNRLNFAITDSLNLYMVDGGSSLNDFTPFGKLDSVESYNNWFFGALNSTFDFTMDIGRRQDTEDLRVWINHKVVNDGHVVGVFSTSLEFDEIFYELFELYTNHAAKGFIIDYRGIVQIDSTMTSHYEFNGGRTHILSIFDDINIVSLINDGFLRNPSIYYGRRTEPEIIRMPGGDSRYLSIAQIPNTNWLAITFFDTTALFDIMSIIPPVGAVVLALILYFVISSMLVRRMLFKPLSKLSNSVDGSIHNEKEIYGTKRKDEIGELARTIREAWQRLSTMAIELKAAADDAEAANLSKSAFLANMSHEIRTPMNVILGVTEILMQDEQLNANSHEELITIYNSGDMLLNIINDILDLSKIEAGKLEMINSGYDIASLIHDSVVLNMMRVGSKPIEFNLNVDEKIPATLIGDELRIKQILGNLLSNAFKYTAQGSVDLSFAGETAEAEDLYTLIISVTDTGQGMTKDEVNLLFDEYSRFINKANHYTEGTGLGMSITRNLVRLMSGTITVESEPEKGSVFTVRLQQGMTDARAIGRDLAESLQDFRQSGVRQMKKFSIVYEHMPYGKVLVVDDVESNLFVARGLMAPYGLMVDTVTSGYKAIEKINAGNEYDIIFMDHMMPKLDGLETTEIIRNSGYSAPIVALSANAVVGQADIFLANGFDDFIPKPVDVRLLNSMLKKFVRDKQSSEVIEAARQERSEMDMNTPEYSGQLSISPQLAEFFVKDALNAIEQLRMIKDKHGNYDDEDIKLFTTTVHAMKNALMNVGEMRLSAYIGKTEQAGWKNDIDTIHEETPTIIVKLQEVAEKYKPLEKETDDYSNVDYTYLQEQIIAIRKACDAYDKKTAKEIIIELRLKIWPSKIKELLSIVAEQLLSGDVDLVSGSIDKIVELIPGDIE